MRLGELLQVSIPGLSAVALGFRQDQWFIGLAVLVLGTALSVLVWDVKRAGGVAQWRKEQTAARNRSSKGKTRRLDEKLKRRRMVTKRGKRKNRR
jgi:protein-S-isoprenylcysteine O-methyltransferase Ste14